jgi:hypothetical protein
MWPERQYFFTLFIFCDTKGNIFVLQSERLISDTSQLLRSSEHSSRGVSNTKTKTNHSLSSTTYNYIGTKRLHVSANQVAIIGQYTCRKII